MGVLLGRVNKNDDSRAVPRTVLWDEGRRCFSFHWLKLLPDPVDRQHYLDGLCDLAPWQEILAPRGDVTRSTCWYTRGRCKCDYTYGHERIGQTSHRHDGFRDLMEELTGR